jgi:hypothetical protein
MKATFLLGAAMIAAISGAASAASRPIRAQTSAAVPYPTFPKQPPLPAETLESCRTPVYSDAEFREMSEVKDVGDARAKFPGSYMFVPAKPGPHPGVLLLHGSGGGRYTPGGLSCLPRLLAARGYAALAFCWFDCGNDAIPQALGDIDLKRTYDAMVWLKQSPHVGGGKVLVSGASRGAEKVSLFASLLGHAAKSDKSIVLPDAVYASAVYGRVVGRFNWRRNPNDERWKQAGGSPADCWADDAKGRHTGPDGRRRSWVVSKCAAEPNWATIFDVPAWRWDRDPARVKPGTDIDLSLYPGPIMVVHGSTDPLWSVEDGPDYLRRTLTARGVRSHHEVVPKFQKRIESWPSLPNDRVLFYIFHDEPHAFSTYGVIARRNLMLAFLERSLR